MTSWGQHRLRQHFLLVLALGLVELEHQGALDEVRQGGGARVAEHGLEEREDVLFPVSRRNFPVEASCIVTVLSASPKTAVQGEAQICKSQTCLGSTSLWGSSLVWHIPTA